MEQPDLHHINIFAKASSATLDRLALCCTRHRFEAGQLLLSRGDDDQSVLLLLEGTVKATLYSTDGREVAIRRIYAGEVLGDYAAIDGQPRSADVIAISDGCYAQVPAREFHQLVTADPHVASAQMQQLVSMVRYLSNRVFALTTRKAPERLAACLLDQAVPAADNQASIDNLPTHTELAAMIGSQRHIVTVELGKLEQAGLLRREGRRVEILDLRALGKRAGQL